MVKRTADQSASTEAPALHGHYDGPRGHQDEHRHLGGDKEHGHADRQGLGRVVGREEYVHGDNLAAVREARRRVEAERKRVAALDDAPTEEIRAVGGDDPGTEPRVVSSERGALVPAGPTANGDRTPGFAELTRIVEHAETQRFEGNTTIELLSILTEAIRQETRRDLVSPDLIDRGLCLFESWAMQRGLRKVEAGGGS